MTKITELSEGSGADWLDVFKSDVSNDIIDNLAEFIKNSDCEPDFILQLTNCMFMFDMVSEEAMIAAMRRHFEPMADEVRVDRLGNVVATIKGKADGPKLLIFAHMDELGLIVRKIDEDGFLRFERVGGVPAKSLLGTWVEIHTDTGYWRSRHGCYQRNFKC